MGIYNDKFLPCLIHKSMSIKKLEPFRKKLVSQASGATLEIGIGSGANLPFYTKAVTSLCGVDHHQAIAAKIDKSKLDSDIPFDLKIISAERLPFDDQVFDTVVSTFTLCSIAGVDKALDEIRRVLKPGGKFLFLEHGKSPKPFVAKVQKVMDVFHPAIAGGCHLSREIFNLTEQADFTIENPSCEPAEFFPAPYRQFYSGSGNP